MIAHSRRRCTRTANVRRYSPKLALSRARQPRVWSIFGAICPKSHTHDQRGREWPIFGSRTARKTAHSQSAAPRVDGVRRVRRPLLVLLVLFLGCATAVREDKSMRRAAPVCSEEVVAVPPSTPGRLDSIRGFLRQTPLRNARLAVSDSMPELANLQEIRQAMTRLYPRELRDAGLGGTTLSFVCDRHRWRADTLKPCEIDRPSQAGSVVRQHHQPRAGSGRTTYPTASISARSRRYEREHILTTQEMKKVFIRKFHVGWSNRSTALAPTPSAGPGRRRCGEPPACLFGRKRLPRIDARRAPRRQRAGTQRDHGEHRPRNAVERRVERVGAVEQRRHDIG